jgi:tol-pal system protein YbgF
MIRHVMWAFALLALAVPPATAQDAAELLVRVGRLESQVRQLSGQIEQLQFQNRRLDEQLRKFQADIEFRFQEQGAAKAPGAAAPPAAAGTPATGVTTSGTTPGTAAPARTARGRGDAFDPTTQPSAPGAPRALGSPDSPSVPAASGARAGGQQAGRVAGDFVDEGQEPAPLDLSTMARGGPGAPPAGGPLPSGALPAGGPLPPASLPPAPPGGAGQQVATAGTGLAKDDYDLAYGLVLQRQYDQAEMAFRQFLQTWPKDRMVPTATYWLGETYYRRQRYPDAVEQYLKIYKSFGSSRIAPDSMLKLALSLRGMGQLEQACATLAEVGRKYPEASADVKTAVDREQKRGNC